MKLRTAEQIESPNKTASTAKTQSNPADQSAHDGKFSLLHLDKLIRVVMPRVPPKIFANPEKNPEVVAVLTTSPTADNKAVGITDSNYLALSDAAKHSGYSEIELLEFASNDSIKLCVHVPSGIDFRPFDNYKEHTGVPLYFPDKLILAAKYCKQIIEYRKTVQSDFKKCYMSNSGKPSLILPGCANLDRDNEDNYVWRAFYQGGRHHLEIKQEDIFVEKDELQSFMFENPNARERLFSTSEAALSMTSTVIAVESLALDTNSKAKDKPPGITDGMVSITKMAIRAAWEIECDTGKKASASQVIDMLKTRVDSEEFSDLVGVIPNGVIWMTALTDDKKYNINACRKTLTAWNKRRLGTA